MPVTLRSDAELAKPIRCILSDVDGVMTDGKIIFDSSGIESKQFHVRDGLGIKRWMRSGFQFAIITGRTSPTVQQRADELGVEHVFQGIDDKLETATTILSQWQIPMSQTCYIGDDLPDLPVMKRVALAVAPADAATDAREAAHWILRCAGGQGAVRELSERLLRGKESWNPPEATR